MCTRTCQASEEGCIVLGPSHEISFPVVDPTLAPVFRSMTSISTRTPLLPETLTLCALPRTGAMCAELQTETDLQETVIVLTPFTVSFPVKAACPRPLPQPVSIKPENPAVTTRASAECAGLIRRLMSNHQTRKNADPRIC
jgi:hypothetical protein